MALSKAQLEARRLEFVIEKLAQKQREQDFAEKKHADYLPLAAEYGRIVMASANRFDPIPQEIAKVMLGGLSDHQYKQMVKNKAVNGKRPYRSALQALKAGNEYMPTRDSIQQFMEGNVQSHSDEDEG